MSGHHHHHHPMDYGSQPAGPTLVDAARGVLDLALTITTLSQRALQGSYAAARSVTHRMIWDGPGGHDGCGCGCVVHHHHHVSCCPPCLGGCCH